MATYEFAGNTINTFQICKLGPIVNRKENDRTIYFFIIHMSGNSIESPSYRRYSDAEAAREDLKTQML